LKEKFLAQSFCISIFSRKTQLTQFACKCIQNNPAATFLLLLSHLFPAHLYLKAGPGRVENVPDHLRRSKNAKTGGGGETKSGF
jgi:hypothetical protein